MTRYHSVILDEDACKGCTVCVTTCPAEAIRVLEGKARIRAERCIDCGVCIRRCPHHAKKALSTALSDALGATDDTDTPRPFRIVLPAPSLYGQFPERFSVADIHASLLELGFDAVFPVAASTPAIARATASFFDRARYPDLPRPLISSSCPTIIKLIQIRFPTLIANVVPVIAPMELSGRLAREALAADALATGRTIHCTFLSPCPGKITESVAPISGGTSSIDCVIAMKDVHLPLLQILTKGTFKKGETYVSSPEEIAWGRAGGEAEATAAGEKGSWIAVDGMEQCIRILEDAENGRLSDISFLELMACTDGCVGGALTAANPSIARHVLRKREEALRPGSDTLSASRIEEAITESFRDEPYPSRSALLLDPDYATALSMMEEIERIVERLPGLDCGCCGAPNCHALAEDIVRGTASLTDCVIILKEQYRELLDQGNSGT